MSGRAAGLSPAVFCLFRSQSTAGLNPAARKQANSEQAVPSPYGVSTVTAITTGAVRSGPFTNSIVFTTASGRFGVTAR